jgi:hypothetical protein
VKPPTLKPAFDYLAAVPKTRESVIHGDSRNSIMEGLQSSDPGTSNIFIVRGPEGVGKTSLLNTIHYSVNSKLKGEFLPISIKFNIDEGELDKTNLLRQLFDQVWETLVNKELVSIDTPEYKDWATKLDSGNTASIEAEFPLRSSSLLASTSVDPTRESGITTGLISTDWQSLIRIARRNMPRLKSFVLVLDNLEIYRGQSLSRLMPMITAYSELLIVGAYHEKNASYFDDYFSNQEWRVNNFDLVAPTEPELDRLIVAELDRISAPRKYFPSPQAFDDLCETSGFNLVDFLIIANAIWEEVRSGRLTRFEINKTVLNRSLKVIKSNSGQNVISEIEKLTHNRSTKFEDIVDILASQFLTLEEIVKTRNFPEILTQEKIEKELVGLRNSFDLLRQSEIIIPLGPEGKHQGLKDRYVDSFIRCLQRDFRAARRGKTFAIGNANFAVVSLMEVWKRIEKEHLKSKRQFPLVARNFEDSSHITDKIFDAIQTESVLEIQGILARRQIAISRGREEAAPLQFYVIEVMLVGLEDAFGLTFGGVIEAPRTESDLQEALSMWQGKNKDLKSYLGITDVKIRFALLNQESTQDLTDISLADNQITTGMRTFNDHDYQGSYQIFYEASTRLKSILSRYGESISKTSRVYKNIKNEIADLDIRASFVKTLLGDLQGAIEGFESINRRDLSDDDTQWIFLDDLENALAFGGFFEKALDINHQATRFRETNIYEGFVVEKGSRYLLMFVPDKETLDTSKISINDKCLYEAGNINDRKIPKLREIFYLNKLNRMTGVESTAATLDLIGDHKEILAPPIMRLILWNLFQFGNNELKLKEIISDIEVMNFERSVEAEDLYDDIVLLKRLLR